MKQKLLLLFALFYFLTSNAQINPPRSEHHVVPCAEALIDSSCNFISNPIFRTTGDSVEDFSDGEIFMWQDVNKFTTDINAALSAGMGWSTPTVPTNLVGANYASMLVDNRFLETEGIAGKTFQIEKGKKYALSFFLSSSALTGYRNSGGTYTFKIFLANCQNFNSTSSGNPAIVGANQLIYCRSFANRGNSDWQQYLVAFSPNGDYNMIVIYPEITSSSYDGGTYVHFLYPELIPINPTNQYQTYQGEKETEGMTLLSACGVTNASYEWTDSASVVSNQQTDILGYDPNRGGNAHYTFSMWVEGAVGNNTENCTDASPPIITETSTQLPTTVRVTCADPVTATSNCNIIPNATFTKTPGNAPNIDAFRQDKVQFWSSVNGGEPDINGQSVVTTSPPNPTNVPVSANAAGLNIRNNVSTYNYEGIYAKIPQLSANRTYAFSFFFNFGLVIDVEGNFTFNIVLSKCQQFPITPNGVGTSSPPAFGLHQLIFCQHFPISLTPGWQQYFVTFTAKDDWDQISIYSDGEPGSVGENYIHFLYPELIDVTNLATVTETSACHNSLQACGVANATYEWVDGNNISISDPTNVDASINPGPYTVTLSVPHILDNPILNNTCSANIETITAQAQWNKATWTGTVSSEWNDINNWVNAVIPPDDPSLDVFIPSGTTHQPTIFLATQPHQPNGFNQVHNIEIESGATLTNNGTLKIAGSISGDAASISNYEGSDVVGSIDMNGNCSTQLLAGNVFLYNDVKNFTASNNVTIAPISGKGLDVYGELGFGAATNTTLATGGNLTLVSTSSTTANVAKIDATANNFISGEVTVERYINTGTGAITNDHAAKWQALATPTGANSIGESVKLSWMENGLVTSFANGYGTNIPDPRSNWNALGFDQLSTGNTAIKTYNSGSNSFDPIANTGIPLYNKNGYFLFVRGDRSVVSFFGIPNPTNLRSKGALFQPYTGYTPPSITVPATIPGSPTIWKFEMIGNPYASPISIDYMKNNGYFSNLTNDVLVWDPLLPGSLGLGGYQTLHASTGYRPTPGGTNLYDATVAYPEIQSGQAFFVGTLANSIAGSVTFSEDIKSSNYRLVTRQSTNNTKSFRANLYYGAYICDGNDVLFANSFRNDLDADDAGKLFNPGENFMIKKADNIFLSVETRRQIQGKDSIFYAFSNLHKATYQLRIIPGNMLEEGLNAILVDNYLHKRNHLSLSDSSFVDFVVDDNKASYENRFMVIFEKNTQTLSSNRSIVNLSTDENSKGSISVYPNPVNDKIINIHYSKMPIGRYKVQLINQSGQILYNNQIMLKENNGLQTIKLGRKIAPGSYQLMIKADNRKTYIQQVIL